MSKKIFLPEESEWRNFWIAVRNIGVWHWREKYVDNRVCDGIEWQLELAIADKEIKSEGYAAYPPNGTGTPAEAFTQLLRALGELINDQEFTRDWYF